MFSPCILSTDGAFPATSKGLVQQSPEILDLFNVAGGMTGITPFIKTGLDVKAEDTVMHHCTAASWALRVIWEGRKDPGHVRAPSFQGHALSSDAAKLFSMCLHGHMGCDLCHLAPRQDNPACSSLPPVTSFGRCVSFSTAAKAAPTTGMN